MGSSATGCYRLDRRIPTGVSNNSLLVERVTYDGQAGEAEITFRPGGVKMLAEDERATA